MPTKRTRLDYLLVQRGLADTRSKARAMIMAGVVRVDGKLLDKPGREVNPTADITIVERYPPYVSRGGVKLEAAVKAFDIGLEGLSVMDVGASTGGFTDCLLKYGASRVVAVDVGYGQLDWSLRNDPRVILLERTNIRHLQRKDLPFIPDGATIDVSFISLRLVIPKVTELLAPTSFIVALIKPQFEVGRELVGKGGVVRDPALRERLVKEIQDFSCELGWQSSGCIPSPILGPKGNQEYLLYLTR
ncbi:MAG: TlyA family rRNA (cytidine-2'-O)-methyltransferase [Deltaproteobacteria bacterium]|nr:MAG: TlyA family rRNA (cytidine-2'-O)-methyltransferase [Deltaproteobacteria bacterium]